MKQQAAGRIARHGPEKEAYPACPPVAELLPWIERSLQKHQNILATSNQGTLLLFRGDGQQLVVKTAMGGGLVRKAREKTLLREYQAYQRLHGVSGIPLCYGMIEHRYLLIEHIEGTPYRHASWLDRDQWFMELLEILQNIHALGVSHGDLKSKGNLLVTADQKPCVIDFGTAFIFRPGFHPVNNWFFRTGRRLDLNAWVKHKYHGHYGNASDTDLELLNYSKLERLVRKVRGRPMDRLKPGDEA